MRSIRVCILDYDRQYAEALAKVLAFRCRDLEVCLFPEEGTWSDGDVLMFNERDEDSVGEEFRGRCLFFSDNPVDLMWEGILDAGPVKACIYKYEAVSKIIAAIRLFYGNSTGCPSPMLAVRDPPVMIGVFSGAGGTGCTSGAVLIGRMLASEYGEKVLFLSFEDINSSCCYFQMESGMPSPEDYLYYFFSEREKKPHVLAGFLHTDFSGLETFYPPQGQNPFCRLHMDALYRLLNHIGKTETYTYMVLDLSTVFSQQQAYLLQCCDAMILWRGSGENSSKDQKCHMKLQQLQREFQIDKDAVYEAVSERKDFQQAEVYQEVQSKKVVKEIVAAIHEKQSRGIMFCSGDYRSREIRDQCKTGADYRSGSNGAD